MQDELLTLLRTYRAVVIEHNKMREAVQAEMDAATNRGEYATYDRMPGYLAYTQALQNAKEMQNKLEQYLASNEI